MNPSKERLKPHPAERFNGESYFIDLNLALSELRTEAHAPLQGHRQVAVFHRAPVTQVLFAFEPGATLADHAANGLVNIHVLEGHLTVRAEETVYELKPGMMAVLSPNVRHSVHAEESSAMLLTVHLQNDH